MARNERAKRIRKAIATKSPTAKAQADAASDAARVVKIDLDEQVILDTAADGSELLRIGAAIAGKTVRFRFPRWGEWDRFCQDMAELVTRLGTAYESFGDISENFGRPEASEYYRAWAEYTTKAILFRKSVLSKLEHVVEYLRPEIEGVDDPMQWLKEHTPIDQVVRLLAAVLSVDDWVKKNGESIATRIFRASIQRPSTRTSEKNSGGPPKSSTPEASYKSVSI